MSDIISPDVRRYVPLALANRTAEEIAVAALQDLATRLPGVTLREGMTEVLLIESLAVEVGELAAALDRSTSTVFEVLLRLFDIDRDTGDPATAALTFTLSDALGHTIPEGTEVAVPIGAGLSPAVFATDEDLVVSPSVTSASVDATALFAGAAPNGVAAGTQVRLRTAIPYVQSVELDTTVIDGRDPETDDAYFLRAAQRLARLTDALVLGPHFTAAALEDPNVFRAFTIEPYDGDGGPPYDDTGHVSVYVYGTDGAVSSDNKSALQTSLSEAAVVNLDVHVLDATVNTVDVEAEINVATGHVPATVIAAVEDALRDWMSPTTWNWGTTVRLNDVIQIIENVTGVDWSTAGSVKIEGVADDYALTGDAPLATAGDLTITVPD